MDIESLILEGEIERARILSQSLVGGNFNLNSFENKYDWIMGRCYQSYPGVYNILTKILPESRAVVKTRELVREIPYHRD